MVRTLFTVTGQPPSAFRFDRLNALRAVGLSVETHKGSLLVLGDRKRPAYGFLLSLACVLQVVVGEKLACAMRG